LNIEVVEKEGLKRELNVEVPREIVDKAYDNIYRQLSKNAKLKGFRPGKVPIKVIRNRFKNEATAEVMDNLINEYFPKALEEKNIEPIGKPVLAKVDIDEGKPLSFTIGFEILPEIDSVKFDDLEFERQSIDIADEEVDRVLEQIRKKSADIRAVERPASDKDILIADMEIKDGEIDLDPETMKNQEIDLDNDYTIEEFREGLVGIERDQTRDIKIEYPEDYSDKTFAGKTVTYGVTAREIKERVLPVLNDDFAKQSGQGETLLELKLNIRKHLEREKRSEQDRIGKKVLIDQIVEKNPIEVPESMVDSYLDGVVEDYKKNEEKLDEKEIRDKYRPVGINTVRWYLIFHRLAAQENIEVSAEDTEKWIKRFADNYRMEVPQAKELLAKTGKANEIRDGILEEKVVDFLMAKAGNSQGTAENKEGNQ